MCPAYLTGPSLSKSTHASRPTNQLLMRIRPIVVNSDAEDAAGRDSDEDVRPTLRRSKRKVPAGWERVPNRNSLRRIAVVECEGRVQNGEEGEEDFGLNDDDCTDFVVATDTMQAGIEIVIDPPTDAAPAPSTVGHPATPSSAPRVLGQVGPSAANAATPAPIGRKSTIEVFRELETLLKEANLRNPARLLLEAKEVALPKGPIDAYKKAIRKASDSFSRQVKEHRRRSEESQHSNSSPDETPRAVSNVQTPTPATAQPDISQPQSPGLRRVQAYAKRSRTSVHQQLVTNGQSRAPVAA